MIVQDTYVQSSNARTQNHPILSASLLESLTANPMISQNLLPQCLYKVYPSAALFTGFSKTPCVSSKVEQKVPKLLTTLYDLKYNTMKEDELASAVKGSHWTSLKRHYFLKRQPKAGQVQEHVLWYNHCIGRITASMFGHVYTCAETKHPTCLDKAIMQYSHVNPAIPWIVIMTTM